MLSYDRAMINYDFESVDLEEAVEYFINFLLEIRELVHKYHFCLKELNCYGFVSAIRFYGG
jgi:hypothetical protein